MITIVANTIAVFLLSAAMYIAYTTYMNHKATLWLAEKNKVITSVLGRWNFYMYENGHYCDTAPSEIRFGIRQYGSKEMGTIPSRKMKRFIKKLSRQETNPYEILAYQKAKGYSV